MTRRVKNTFKSNKYTKKIRSKEAISQSVKEMVQKVRDLSSVEAIKASINSIASRLREDKNVFKHFRSKMDFYKLLKPL